ncbi:MAG: ORF6N domain-containing protein [Candidatus Cloacimonetes bacterium]|nr:ORF6N domain-containing protein [Candidatus Cloacimonadota bacterium]
MNTIIPIENIVTQIYLIRKERVILDADLARLYGVETKVLNQAVKRNIKRFPQDFMFHLSKEEFENLKSQIVTSSRGGRRTLPYAFTEQGIAMLSSVLNSERAIQVNITIMRAFVQIRKMIQSNEKLRKEFNKMKQDYDFKFQVIFEMLQHLIDEPEVVKSKEIGFKPLEK